ncbi:transposase, partial [Flavobacterium sp. RHBU_24]
MERKVKYNYEFKLRCVYEVLKKSRSVKSVATAEGMSLSQLKRWI